MPDYSTSEIEEAVTNGETLDRWGLSVGGWERLSEANIGSLHAHTIRGELVDIEKVGGKGPRAGGGRFEAVDDVSVIIRVGDQYFEKCGYYSSYDSTRWDGRLHQVRLVVKTVTVYE